MRDDRRQILIRLGLFVLLLPVLLVGLQFALHFAPDAWVGKWFSAWWILGLRLTAIGLLAFVILRFGVPRFFRRRWGLWLAGGLVVSLAALWFLVVLTIFGDWGDSKTLTTAPCVRAGVPMTEVRSCRYWNNGFFEPDRIVLARGPLEPSRCPSRSASGKCDLDNPLTWREVPCASVALPKASRCFQCKQREVGGLDGSDFVAYLRVLGLIDGCRDAIYFAGDNAGIEELRKEIRGL